MASDAKVGLLLGLVFIFIIALIINGLPSFNEDRSNNELTTNMVGSRNRSPAIAAKQREVINRRVPVVKKPAAVELASADNQDIQPKTTSPEDSPIVIVKQTPAEQAIAAVAQVVAAKAEGQEAASSQDVSSKVYVISEGDTLAGIARKFYGAQEGNKRANVARIFDANRKVLKSPDKLYIGQKIVIPPLPGSAPDKGKSAAALSEKEFVKVKAIGRRRLLANDYKADQNRWHVVQRGDSLWQIAAEQLGDGSRYGEIAKLNAGTLDGADNLFVGMRLKIPVR